MKTVFIFFFSLIAVAAVAQSKGNGKIYGYRQSVAPGIVRKELSEDGTETVTQPRSRENYYIYLVTPARAYPSEIWINGEVYSASVRSISQTPVEQTDRSVPSEPVSKVLVPKTKQRVIQITPMPATGAVKGNTGRKLAASNELVIVYRQNGKFFYQTLAAFAELNGAAMQ